MSHLTSSTSIEALSERSTDSVVASGVVTVRSLDTGEEWDEEVEVFESDVEGRETTIDDEASFIAVEQASPEAVEVLETNLS